MLKMFLQYFAEGDNDGDNNPPVDDKQVDDKKADGNDNDDKPKKVEMTQEELDALIAKRLEREKKKYADYDDLKTKLSDYEKAEEERKKADMSEIERLQAEKDEALKKVEEYEGKASQALSSANERLKRAEFRLLAKEMNVRNDAIDDAFKLADLSAVEVDEDGNVKGVKEALETLSENKKWLFESKQKPKEIGDNTSHKNDKSEKTKEQLLAEAAEKARRTGRSEDRAAYARLKQELK